MGLSFDPDGVEKSNLHYPFCPLENILETLTNIAAKRLKWSFSKIDFDPTPIPGGPTVPINEL